MQIKRIDIEKHISTRTKSYCLITFLMFSFLPFSVCYADASPSSKRNTKNTEEECKKEDKKEAKKEEPPSVGNFALPTPQQPGPLLSFGQHVIDKDQSQLFVFTDYFGGSQKHRFDIVPSFLYGLTDDFSVFFNVPIAASYKDGKQRSSGLEDIFLQLEHAFYANKNSEFSEQGTLVTNFIFPTGSAKKQPPTGFGSPSFFLGTTFSRTYTDWLAFVSPGVLLPTSYEGTKFGNVFFYQCGFGRNILGIPSELIVTWMVEIEGQYTEKSKIHSKTDPNSGGNVIFVTPSIWISTKKLIIQLGVGLPATQHLFGAQKKSRYLLSANFGWTF